MLYNPTNEYIYFNTIAVRKHILFDLSFKKKTNQNETKVIDKFYNKRFIKMLKIYFFS